MSQKKLNIEATLEKLQFESFSYFMSETNLENGLVRDKNAPNWPASIAAVGFALASYPVAVERGFISRQEAVNRVQTTLKFFWNSPQGPEPNATGHHGFYYHFLDMQTGRRAWECELSTIDSALLLAGALSASQYFDACTPEEQNIRTLANELYLRADWRWAIGRSLTVSLGWKPKRGFLTYRWQGYNEGLLLYILGLGSPTHPLPQKSYEAWASSYEWVNSYGYDYLYSGALFTHQFSHIWIDFRGIQDAFMRKQNSDYFENSRKATLIQQRYAIDNPHGFNDYSSLCWGITASDGPGSKTLTIQSKKRKFYHYIARGVPYGPDDGTLSPWAMVASLPFAPDIVLPAIEHCLHELDLKTGYSYSFKASFNTTFSGKKNNPHGWISPWNVGINQGPIVLMIENYRSGLLWELMRTCPYIEEGLRRADFKGGWLP
ncbi:MAG: glucoamylase family protein [Pseudomonadota bacterium]